MLPMVMPSEMSSWVMAFVISFAGDGEMSSSKKPHIRFGLGAIKNVGQNAIQPIIDERIAN